MAASHSWLEDPGDMPSLRVGDGGNFFDCDESDETAVSGMMFTDPDQVDGIMQKWKTEATKKMKMKPQTVAKPIKLDEMAETIGEKFTDTSDRKQKGKGSVQRSLPVRDTPPSLVKSSRSATVGEFDFENSTRQFPDQTRRRTSTSPTVCHDHPQQVEVLKAPPVKQTVNKILVGKPAVLEWYRSRREKEDLLKEAIATHDGNAIITVLLFIEKTLCRALFESLLAKYPMAASHYCSFLRQNSSWNELKSIYHVLGEESFGMLQFQLCLSTDDYSYRVSSLDKCAMVFRSRPSLVKEAVFVEEYRDLLSNQLKIQGSKFSRSAMASSTLLDSTLMVTLKYLQRFHSKDPETQSTSPVKMQQDFHVSARQYFVVQVAALCARNEWDEIERLLTPKGISSRLGLSSKVKSPIPLERLIRILAKYNPPEELLAKYVKLIDDLELRLDLAKKCKCHGVVIETLTLMKAGNQKINDYYSSLSVEAQRKYRPKFAKILNL